MSEAVLVRFIEFLEIIFGRINSKRLMVLYGFLGFLASDKFGHALPPLSVWVATGMSALVLILYVIKPNGNESPPAPPPSGVPPAA